MVKSPQNKVPSSREVLPEKFKASMFKPGKSGNPGGRPKGLMQAIRKSTKDGKVLAEFWIKLVEGKIKGATMADRVTASRLLAEHGFGKPVQVVANPDGGPVDFNFNLTVLSDQELDGLERTVDKITVPNRN